MATESFLTIFLLNTLVWTYYSFTYLVTNSFAPRYIRHLHDLLYEYAKYLHMWSSFLKVLTTPGLFYLFSFFLAEAERDSNLRPYICWMWNEDYTISPARRDVILWRL